MSVAIHPRVAAGTLAGAAVGLAFNILQNHYGITINAAEGSDITVLVSFALAWLLPTSVDIPQLTEEQFQTITTTSASLPTPPGEPPHV